MDPENREIGAGRLRCEEDRSTVVESSGVGGNNIQGRAISRWEKAAAR
jgi:hypothetical protein